MATDHDLCETFIAAHPSDAAQVLERQSTESVAALLDVLSRRTVADVIARMVPTLGAECLAALRPENATEVVRELPVDVAAGLLWRLDDGARGALLDALRPDDAAPLRVLLRHPEGTAGAFMDPRALALPDDVTVGEGLARVKRSARDMLSYLYVVDRDRKLVGVLSVRELILARPAESLAAVMHSPVAGVPASLGRTAILTHPGWRDFHALPVVDDDGVFLGALRYRTLRRLLEAEPDRPIEAAMSATIALGELYWFGLSSLFQGVAGAATRVKESSEREEGPHGS
jgi:magnesium transporter